MPETLTWRRGRPEARTLAAIHASMSATARAAAARGDSPRARADFRRALFKVLAPVSPRQRQRAGDIADVFWRLGAAARRDAAAVAAAARWADLRRRYDAIRTANDLLLRLGRAPAGEAVAPAVARVLWVDAVDIVRAAAGSAPARRVGRTPVGGRVAGRAPARGRRPAAPAVAPQADRTPATTPGATLDRFCSASAFPHSAAAGLRSYRGWTAGRVRAAYDYLGLAAGVPVRSLTAAAAGRLVGRLIAEPAGPAGSEHWIEVAAERAVEPDDVVAGDDCARFERCLGGWRRAAYTSTPSSRWSNRAAGVAARFGGRRPRGGRRPSRPGYGVADRRIRRPRDRPALGALGEPPRRAVLRLPAAGTDRGRRGRPTTKPRAGPAPARQARRALHDRAAPPDDPVLLVLRRDRSPTRSAIETPAPYRFDTVHGARRAAVPRVRVAAPICRRLAWTPARWGNHGPVVQGKG